MKGGGGVNRAVAQPPSGAKLHKGGKEMRGSKRMLHVL